MKRNRQSMIIALIVGVFLLMYIHIILIPYPTCESSSSYMNEVFTYDRIQMPISRKDVFITGKILKEKVPLLIGIPSVYRQHNNTVAFYLDQTIESLINPLSPEDKKEVHILIILADQEKRKKAFIHQKIKHKFTKELKNGLISIIEIPNRFYDKLTGLTPTFKDSPERMYWRSKQSLDYAFIFQYVHSLCDYYLQIEDDVLANEQYFTTIMDDIERLNRVRNKQRDYFPDENVNRKYQPWTVSEYYHLGFIGRLIKSQYLPLLSGFIKVFYDQIPVDWGYPHLFKMTGKLKAINNPDLFTHIGKQSSSLGT